MNIIQQIESSGHERCRNPNVVLCWYRVIKEPFISNTCNVFVFISKYIIARTLNDLFLFSNQHLANK